MTTNELLERCHKLVRESLPEWSDDTKNEIARRIFSQIEPLHHSRRDMDRLRPIGSNTQEEKQ